jgi:hypothetical protein
MTPTTFPEANTRFVAPDDLDPSQVMAIPGWRGWAIGGSLDGCPLCVVAWTPTEAERAAIAEGKPIFISLAGGLAPHFPAMSFEEASRPA